jgi:hypothetical protein
MSTRDQITVAQLQGQATHCVHHGTPAEVAVTELREITQRPDLLAHAAGILAGAADPQAAERPWRIAAARLLVQAGADRAQLPRWIAKGRSNVSSPVGWGTQRIWPQDLDQVLAEILAAE